MRICRKCFISNNSLFKHELPEFSPKLTRYYSRGAFSSDSSSPCPPTRCLIFNTIRYKEARFTPGASELSKPATVCRESPYPPFSKQKQLRCGARDRSCYTVRHESRATRAFTNEREREREERETTNCLTTTSFSATTGRVPNGNNLPLLAERRLTLN